MPISQPHECFEQVHKKVPDLQLSSDWKITLNDPTSINQSYTTIGEFNTINSFWCLYNTLLSKQLMQTLPLHVHISIYRNNQITSCVKQWHGEWKIKIKHKANPIKIFTKIILLIIGEKLTHNIKSLVLTRTASSKNSEDIDFTVSIFTDSKNPKIDVKNILLSKTIIDLNDCIKNLVSFHPFQILYINKNKSNSMDIYECKSIQQHDVDKEKEKEKRIQNEEKGEEKGEEKVKEEEEAYIEYDIDQLLSYSKLYDSNCNKIKKKGEEIIIDDNEQKVCSPTTSLASSTINSNSSSRSDLNINNKIISFYLEAKYDEELVYKLFGEHSNRYNLKYLKDEIPDKLKSILLAEGCVICMQTTLHSPYIDNDNNNDDGSPTQNTSYVVVQCSSLNCQHLAHYDCIINSKSDSIKIRPKHCSLFFETISLTDSNLSDNEIKKEIGCVTDIDHNYNISQKKYFFHFKINHLISNQTSMSPMTVPSYNKKQKECLQIFFDHTHLQISRGTIQVKIMEQLLNKNDNKLTVGKMWIHDVNFEIPYSLINDDKRKKKSKIYQLRYSDKITGNTLVINVRMKLKPNYILELLSLTYEIRNNSTQKTLPIPLPLLSRNSSAQSACNQINNIHHPHINQIESIPVGSIITLPPRLTASVSTMSTTSNNNNNNNNNYITPPPPMIIPITPLNEPINTMPLTHQLHHLNLHHLNLHHHHHHHHSTLNPLSIPINNINQTINNSVLLPIPVTVGTHSPFNAAPMAYFPPPPPPPPPTSTCSVSNSIEPLFIEQIQIQQQNQMQSIPQNNNNNLLLPLPTSLTSKYESPRELYYFACSHLGSSYITSKIKNPIYFKIFFNKLKQFFSLLMINSVGHAVCRALYSQVHCQISDKIVLLETLLPYFSRIASNRQGSFALICIMTLITTSNELDILSKGFCFGNQFDDIIFSQSGYHVIKKFIGFGYPHFNLIINEISKDFTKYATHHYGVPIIRSILDIISSNPLLIQNYSNCLQLFALNTHSLVCNQYGNYVIQQLLEISPSFVTDTIKEFMLTKFSTYSKQKFSSNVVEKCLKHTLIEKNKLNKIENKLNKKRRNWTKVIVLELLNNAKELINHKYGNYCLQTALSICIGDQILLKQFIDKTHPLLHTLRLNVRKKWQHLLKCAITSDYNAFDRSKNENF